MNELKNTEINIELLNELKRERKKVKALEETVAVQNQQIMEMRPKIDYYDIVLNCESLTTISTIAKDYGKSVHWINNYLCEKGVQFKQGNIWLLYKKYAEMGYTGTKTHKYSDYNGTAHTNIHTQWTQKGRLFIYELMKNDNILPLIEQEKAS